MKPSLTLLRLLYPSFAFCNSKSSPFYSSLVLLLSFCCCCWLGHFKMSFYYPTSYEQGNGVAYSQVLHTVHTNLSPFPAFILSPTSTNATNAITTKVTYKQCDQMTRLFVQYLAIGNIQWLVQNLLSMNLRSQTV